MYSKFYQLRTHVQYRSVLHTYCTVNTPVSNIFFVRRAPAARQMTPKGMMRPSEEEAAGAWKITHSLMQQ